VGEAQKRGRPKKRKNKKTNIFLVGGQKEEHVIRKRGYLVLYFCSRKRNAKKIEIRRDVGGVA
jgi:hypothetical protein